MLVECGLQWISCGLTELKTEPRSQKTELNLLKALPNGSCRIFWYPFIKETWYKAGDEIAVNKPAG